MATRHIARLAVCARLAAAQYGVIGRAQALVAGLSASSIDRLIADGTWTSIWPNVYALWVPSDAATLWRHRIFAASLWLGEHSAISHRAAALILGWDGIESAPFEYSTLRRKRTSRPGYVIYRTRTLEPADTIRYQGFTITAPVRTITDLSAILDRLRLERVLESALRRGDLTLEELKQLVEENPSRMPGLPALKELVEGHPGTPTDSDLETIVWQIIRAAGLPLPVRQYWILDERGRRVARADFVYVEQRLIIEPDGFGSHSKLDDWLHDRRRQNAVVRLGWTVYRVPYRDAHGNPEQVAREIAELLRAGGTSPNA